MDSAGTKLLVLCTIAVAATYAGAYAYTQPLAQSTSLDASLRHGGERTSTPLRPRPEHALKTTAAKYKDGTYTGSGANPYGTLSVSVTIAGGRISSVMITSYNMHYPLSFIDPFMNKEMIKNQTYRVYAVSGATASSDNFAEAVYFALQKAKV
jgi:uncharacterized protein with FMN-binding domain